MTKPLAMLTLLLLLSVGAPANLLPPGSSPVCQQGGATSPTIPHAPRALPPDVVPGGTKARSWDEAAWWMQVRRAGRDAYLAWKERADAVARARRKGLPSPSGHEPFYSVLSKNGQENLNARLSQAKSGILELLRIGTAKGYRPPLADQRPLLLYLPMPSYTEIARKEGIQGTVKMRAQFAADGVISIIKVTQSLPDGLEWRAKEAVMDLLFLPAVKDGAFISFQQEVEISFALRK